MAEYQRVARDILANCPGPIIYAVLPGDTLGSIANHYYGSTASYHKILKANRDKVNDSGDFIPVGTKLMIPK